MKTIEEAVLQTAAELAESISLNRIVGQMYALLYFSPEPVSMDDIATKLKISKGSVSNNIRILEEWKAVKHIVVAGSRRDFYSAEPDFMKIVLERLERGLERRINLANEKFQGIQKLVAENGDKKSRAFYSAKIKKLEELKDLAESGLKFLPMARNLGKLKLLSSFLKK